eukprot:324948_1
MRVEVYGEPISESIDDALIYRLSQSDITWSDAWPGLTTPKFTSDKSWSAGSNSDSNTYLQLNLGLINEIGKIATTGRGNNNQWVRSFKLQYSTHGEIWLYYDSKDYVFTANTDRNTAIVHKLSPPIKAQFLRFIPVTYYRHKSMRVEVYSNYVLQPLIVTDDSTTSFLWKSAHSSCNNDPSFSSSSAWCSLTKNDETDYLLIDLGSLHKINSVSTKGRGDHNQYITSYKLRYSPDGVQNMWYNDQQPINTGNTDSNTEKNQILTPAIYARYLVIYPVEYFGHKSMRVEVFGSPVYEPIELYSLGIKTSPYAHDGTNSHVRMIATFGFSIWQLVIPGIPANAERITQMTATHKIETGGLIDLYPNEIYIDLLNFVGDGVKIKDAIIGLTEDEQLRLPGQCLDVDDCGSNAFLINLEADLMSRFNHEKYNAFNIQSFGLKTTTSSTTGTKSKVKISLLWNFFVFQCVVIVNEANHEYLCDETNTYLFSKCDTSEDRQIYLEGINQINIENVFYTEIDGTKTTQSANAAIIFVGSEFDVIEGVNKLWFNMDIGSTQYNHRPCWISPTPPAFYFVSDLPKPCTIKVLSVEQNGEYFNFEIEELDKLLNRPDWDETNLQIHNSRTDEISTCIVRRNPYSGGTSDIGHGSQNDGTQSTSDWQSSDILTILKEDLYCKPLCSLQVLSAEHSNGQDGKYFNFLIEIIDAILDRTDWHNTNFNIYNLRTQQISKCIVWRGPYAGGTAGVGHGRKNDGTQSTSDWQAGDMLSIIGINLNCYSSNCALSVESTTLGEMIGKYFSYDKATVDGIFGGTTSWTGNYLVLNSRTMEIGKIIMWRSTATGRYDNNPNINPHHGATAGDFQTGDQLSFIGHTCYEEASSINVLPFKNPDIDINKHKYHVNYHMKLFGVFIAVLMIIIGLVMTLNCYKNKGKYAEVKYVDSDTA